MNERERKTSSRRIAATERQADALKLRIQGVDFRTIADKLGYRGPSGAYGAVDAALKKTLSEPAAELRQLELLRLDMLLMAVWPQAVTGQMGAVDRVLRIMQRRAALLGLDEPSKFTIDDIQGIASHVVEVIHAEVEDEAVQQRIFTALGFLDAARNPSSGVGSPHKLAD